MSIWIPIAVTLAGFFGWWLLVFPGKWRAEASMLATAVCLVVTIAIWLVYGAIHLWKWTMAALTN